MRERYVLLSLVAFLAFILCLWGCKKSEIPNPFDDIDYSDTTKLEIPLDTTSFSFLHRVIFSPKCAHPGCHDGTFEPDFRNVQSAYSTLVYHPIIKNNEDGDFIYRVVPYDTSKSVLHERLTNCCFVNVDDRMPQDNIGIPLSDRDINLIERWILSGAKNMFGYTPNEPDHYPVIDKFIATNSDFSIAFSQNRIDNKIENSFIVPKDSLINIGVFVSDDHTAVCDMVLAQLKLSYDIDFTAVIKTCTSSCVNANAGKYAWMSTFNAADLNPGSTVYMRYYVNDGKHADDVEFPNFDSQDGYKTHWSFYVQP